MAGFAATVFLSAYLLFFVQPMIARFILPWFGGAPAVWTTCMLFFQVALLGGYAYAHALNRVLAKRTQVYVHLGIALLTLAVLPVTPRPDQVLDRGHPPVFQILVLLLFSIGAPYFLLSTTGPLLQAWFASRYPKRSPYRLYALSNVGSLFALLGYPFLIEPYLGTVPQSQLWSLAYAIFVLLLVAVGGITLANSPPGESPLPESNLATPKKNRSPLDAWSWVGLATIPSVLLLAITNQLCQDVAVIPFLWILPLSLYLISFIICFDRPAWYVREIFVTGMLLTGAAVIYAMCRADSVSLPFQLIIYPAFLFFGCMVCHGELAARQPDPADLTGYYLSIAVGGALGGVCVVFCAPLVFVRFYELHWAVGAALLGGTLLAWRAGGARTLLISLRRSAVLGMLLVWGLVGAEPQVLLAHRWAPASVAGLWGLFAALMMHWAAERRQTKSEAGETEPPRSAFGFYWCVAISCFGSGLAIWIRPDWLEWLHPLLLALTALLAVQVLLAIALFPPQRLGWISRVGVALGSFAGAAFLWDQAASRPAGLVEETRGFYGLVSAATEGHAGMTRGELVKLYSGRISHGWQYRGVGFERTPTSYYGELSGVGRALQLHRRRQTPTGPMNIGVIGLGAGVLATWTQPGDSICFFEINPQMVDFAKRHFTFLDNAFGSVSIELGDGRLLLEQKLNQPDFERWDLLAIDAFSGDSVPRHLLTEECFRLYARALADDGVLAVHITNGYIDARPVVFELAERVGLVPALIVGTTRNVDEHVPQADSVWVLASRDREWIESPALQAFVSPFPRDRRLRWTDDFGSPAQLLKLPRPGWWPGPWPEAIE